MESSGKTPETPEAALSAFSTDMAENGHGGSPIPKASLENSKVNVICFYSYRNAFPLSRKYAYKYRCVKACCFVVLIIRMLYSGLHCFLP